MDVERLLRKKAKGYTAEEIVEEYAVDKESGELLLSKRKVTKKHIPPDLAAIKVLLGGEAGGEELNEATDAELIELRERLIREWEETKHGDYEDRDGSGV